MADKKICMFTGHRAIPTAHITSLSVRLDHTIENVISKGYTTFCAGGAVGFDTLVALKIIERKRKGENLRLCLYLPCKGQDSLWSDGMRKTYRYILENADEIKYSYDDYVKGCMQKRNRQMVDDSSLCVAYCGTDKGGSRYTIKYAEKKGIPVINLYN